MLILRHTYDRKQPRLEIARAHDVVVRRVGGSAKPWEHFTCDSPDAATRRIAAEVAEYLTRGYVQSGDEDDTAESMQPELEAAIRADPDNPSNYLVLADWLQSQGDPRGELIAVHYALSPTGLDDGSVAASPHRTHEKLRVADLRKLRSAHARLMRSHTARFMGPSVAEHRYVAAGSWLFGYLHSATLEMHDTPSLSGKLDAVLRHPSMRFVQHLRVDLAITEEWGMLQSVMDLLARQDPRPPLTEIEIRSHSAARAAQAEALCAAYPRLKRLDISSPIGLGSIRHATLESLGLHPSSLTTFKELPRLRKLRLHDPQTAAQIGTVLNGPTPSTLRELTLDPVRLTKDLASAIADSRLLSQLEALHLVGSFSEESINEVLRWRARFRHLKRLTIKSAAVSTSPQLKAFKQLGPSVEIADS